MFSNSSAMKKYLSDWRVRGVEEVILKSKVSKGRMQSKMKKLAFIMVRVENFSLCPF